MIRVALAGLGKMGLSHCAIINTHPDIELAAVCDTSEYLLSVLGKHSKIKTYKDYRKMLHAETLDAVIIATPSRYHANMIHEALAAGLHVFCEKPLCLDAEEGITLADLAERKKRVNQVGYHHRFIATFHEMKRLLEFNVLGKLHHIRAEAHGPVVLKSKGGTWRTKRHEGGGCLYDYASHAIDLANYLVGRPRAVGGTIMNSLFSGDVEDEVYANLFFSDNLTGQIAANWSDESQRKMSTQITVWGANGKISADRQEMQIYLRDDAFVPDELRKGWNTRYTTDLTDPVWFYLRGEEYSAQLHHFVDAIKMGSLDTRSTFRSAAETDLVISAMVRDSDSPLTETELASAANAEIGKWASGPEVPDAPLHENGGYL
jgi:scyllo-inositol 2-dehydrogenase (NADP+)